MDQTAFHRQVTELEEFLMEAITYFFEQRGLAFDPVEFVGEGTTDMHALAKEAHFYGAQVFPEEEISSRSICA